MKVLGNRRCAFCKKAEKLADLLVAAAQKTDFDQAAIVFNRLVDECAAVKRELERLSPGRAESRTQFLIRSEYDNHLYRSRQVACRTAGPTACQCQCQGKGKG